jgi:hypothetical protein
MTDKEKKLMDLLKDAQYIKDGYGGYKIDEEDTFNAIIKAFPQILADNAFDGIPNAETLNDFGGHLYSMSEQKKHIQVFIREVKS